MNGMSNTKSRFPKTVGARLVECEAHTVFLDKALRNMGEDPISYKQVASELRVLVAEHKPDNRLVQSLMDELGVSIDVKPSDQGCQVVRKGGVVEPWEGSIPFKDYVEIGLACVVSRRPYKNGEFIRMVAQQEGSSHESTSLDEALHVSYNFVFDGVPVHVHQLAAIGRTVRSVAVDFIRHLIANRGYAPRYDWDDVDAWTKPWELHESPAPVLRRPR